MSDFAPEPIATRVFLSLHQRGFNLGVSELLAAIDAIRGGVGANDLNELRLTLQLLWCHSLAEQSQFALVWDTVMRTAPPTQLPSVSPSERLPEVKAELPPEPPAPLSPQLPPQPPATPAPAESTPELVPYPVRSPFTPTEIDDFTELQTYYPVSRRSLAYGWRSLRRSAADGPLDVEDLEETVRQVSLQGFFLAPAYRRREVNHAHLVLLIDQGGSMMPLHRFTRDVVETAQQDSTIETVAVYYFHNVPAEDVYEDVYLTQPMPFMKVVESCDQETSLLIVSDAGAARGYRRMQRIRQTTEFLAHFQQRTNLICWLNPMPIDRWQGSSAEIIAYLVSMEPMNDDGLNRAIDVVRGRLLPAIQPKS